MVSTPTIGTGNRFYAAFVAVYSQPKDTFMCTPEFTLDRSFTNVSTVENTSTVDHVMKLMESSTVRRTCSLVASAERASMGKR